MKRLVIALLLTSLIGCGKAPPTTRVNYWVQTLHANDAKLRKKAAFTLGNLGTVDPGVVPALRGALTDADAAVRCEAILALLKCGPAAAEAVPALQHLQQHDPNAQVRRYAAQAVEKLAP
jgi:HEAT repeat protein